MRYLWGGQAPPRSAAQERIDSFGQMVDGWHYGAGMAPSEAVRNRASSILEKMQMLGLAAVHVSAGPDGEILLAATAGSDYFSISVEENGTFSFNHEQYGEEVEYAEDITQVDLVRRLTLATGALWNISDLYIQDHSIENDASSMTWLSKSPPVAECLFLRWNAQLPRVA